MNKFIYITIGTLALIIVGLLIVNSGKSKAINSVRHITMDEAIELMGDNEYTLVDVRELTEYDEGHIPGAINISVNTIDKSVVELLPDKDKMILVYCRSGVRSREAASKLESLGYTNIVDIGGIINWKGEIEK